MPRLVALDIADELRRRIHAGRWNGRIPPERDLAHEFGVSRNTVRRAVGVLEADGAVVRQVGRGTFLQQPVGGSIAAVIKRMEGVSPADMMEVRQLLEPPAAAFAATNASVTELAAIREAHEKAVVATDMPTFEHWDAEFHHRIFACSRNEFLHEMHNLMRILRSQAPWFEMKQRSFSEQRRVTYCDEHAVIADALLSRNPDGARQAMARHLTTVSRNLLGS